ncbi:hypothetical protein FHX42_004645 [Saccharopolyspora lacisalsi]|uniref:DUF2993 domain-containing protein n=1 Tax=Halosaccharopolyspora lacisalsi TaxID=1000566 RepID=A0A839E7L0_9PSEU|nr:DUF2993 domain-containing protein [Halosaccharopolyspora lacisalsi]MBA8827261.1 hypothetical protein [Halosaccharopolyspora lacisalsi]
MKTKTKKKLAITLAVVVALLVGADFSAAAIAEHQVSRKMRTQLKLAHAPAVRINGFPFLTQATSGDFHDVSIKAKGVRVDELTEVGVRAHLYHARVSTSALMAGKADELQVDEVVGRLRLKASDIGRFIGIGDLNIAPAPANALRDSSGGSDNSVTGSDSGSGSGSESGSDPSDPTETTIKLDGTVNIASTDNHVQVIATLSLVDGKLRIEPRELKLDNSAFGPIPLPDIFEQSVLDKFTTTLDPGQLPFTVTPTAVRAEHGALIVEGTAHEVKISPKGMSTG